MKKLSLNSARKKSARGSRTFSPMGFSNFIKTLLGGKNPFLNTIIGTFLEKNVSAGRISLDPTVFEVSGDLKNFLSAVEETSEIETRKLF